MEKLEHEIGSMRARIENLHLDMVELRDDVKSLSLQVSMGRGAVKVIGITGTLVIALTTFAAWIGQTLRPFTP
ncbi:hypothetical protein [Sneathiella chinensis]|uniref:Uncharacterized protein n=1 Tax=Sneathiella chinensis TaxID=349750 RepID=A0ABQ5U8H6_9PROT|nr:hypothetical protein [Sneathiella chinensis]GLQ07503.1 hypothetical protein GCM10007924_27240 [Sneathiella chinensis]